MASSATIKDEQEFHLSLTEQLEVYEEAVKLLRKEKIRQEATIVDLRNENLDLNEKLKQMKDLWGTLGHLRKEIQKGATQIEDQIKIQVGMTSDLNKSLQQHTEFLSTLNWNSAGDIEKFTQVQNNFTGPNDSLQLNSCSMSLSTDDYAELMKNVIQPQAVYEHFDLKDIMENIQQVDVDPTLCDVAPSCSNLQSSSGFHEEVIQSERELESRPISESWFGETPASEHFMKCLPTCNKNEGSLTLNMEEVVSEKDLEQNNDGIPFFLQPHMPKANRCKLFTKIQQAFLDYFIQNHVLKEEHLTMKKTKQAITTGCALSIFRDDDMCNEKLLKNVQGHLRQLRNKTSTVKSALLAKVQTS